MESEEVGDEEIGRYQDCAQILKEVYDELDETIREKQRIKGYAKYKLEQMVKTQESLFKARHDLLELIGALM